MDRRALLLNAGACGLAALVEARPGLAAERDTIVVAIGDSINSLDIHRSGTNRPSYQVAINAYDRLLSFGTTKGPSGNVISDFHSLHGELAESWEVAPDGLSATFKLKPGAVFWDGTPVTANDVKWSFDRAVSIGGFPTMQMGAGRMAKPEQFTVIDPKTIKVAFTTESKLSLPDLATPVAIVINSKVAKAHATAADPWAADFLNRNAAGSGAYKVERWDPGQQLVYTRNDLWKAGPPPQARRVIMREIPSKATRRALVERGDIQIDFDIPGKDALELKQAGKLKVASSPIPNTVNGICLNLAFEPFQDRRVRQAVAWALPYEQIFEQAAYGQGMKMYGGASFTPKGVAWPQPFPYVTDPAKAKDLLGRTAYKAGFKVPLSLDLNTAEWGEPTALLIQESLGKIGIECAIDRVPGASWRTLALVQKKFPMIIDTFGGWLDTPEYFFYWTYLKGNLFNASNYDNPEIAAIVQKTLNMKTSDPTYAPSIERMLAIAIEDVPRIPLWQPALASAMTPIVEGYETWFHRMIDARHLALA